MLLRVKGQGKRVARANRLPGREKEVSYNKQMRTVDAPAQSAFLKGEIMRDKGQEARGKLMPCPFCGGEAIRGMACHVHEGYAFRVECRKCKIVTPFYDTEAEAIEAWNRRVHIGDANEMRTAKVVNKEIDYRDDEYEHDRLGGQFQKGKCGICKHLVIEEFDFCPSCGARLEWE